MAEVYVRAAEVSLAEAIAAVDRAEEMDRGRMEDDPAVDLTLLEWLER